MSQELINLREIAANLQAWDADVENNVIYLRRGLRTLKLLGVDDGGGLFTFSVQLQDANGTNISEQFNLRARVTPQTSGFYSNSTEHTIAPINATVLLESITVNKDIVVRSNSTGFMEVRTTRVSGFSNPTVIFGHAPFVPVFSNSNNSKAM